MSDVQCRRSSTFTGRWRDPNNPYVQTNLADALVSVGKNDQAIEHFAWPSLFSIRATRWYAGR